MENIIKILKTLNKKTRNATARIKNIDDYLKLVEKIGKDEKNYNTVFLLEFDELPINVQNKLSNIMIKIFIKNSKYIILLNKDNYFYVALNHFETLNILTIKKFLELEIAVEDSCLVCLEKNTNLVFCPKCACNICRECEQKLDKCPICKIPSILVKKIIC